MEKPPNPALLYTADAVDTGRPQLMGRHAAGEGFFKAYLRHAGVSPVRLAVRSEKGREDFLRRAAEWGFANRPTEWMSVHSPKRLGQVGALFVPDPLLDGLAWRRRAVGNRAYSLCGVNHTIASEKVMDGMAALLTAPLQPWDAVVCTSRAVKLTLLGLLDRWGGYLQERLGTRRRPRPLVQLPVIPLGVDCDAFARGEPRDRARAALRKGLGIGDEDLAVLFLGRLSYHAKAHPQPLYLALENAARRAPDKRLHLILAGWFANEAIEGEFRRGAAALCPSVSFHVLDGREADARAGAWAAADIFMSLSDNIQETFGLTPVEAMAAGLPAIVSDWNGYKDTVRHGTDGFRVPTLMPEPGSGLDLALPAEPTTDAEERDRLYNRYCGKVGQFAVVDPLATTEALVALVANPDLRRGMGEAGRAWARERFDWRVVIAAYQVLWRELAERRERAAEVAPCGTGEPANPLRDDPFRLFAAYPTVKLTGATRVAALGKTDGNRLRAVKGMAMNDVAAPHMPEEAELAVVLAHLGDGQARTAAELAALLPSADEAAKLRGIAWLGKMGLVRLLPDPPETHKGKALAALGKRDLGAAADLFRKAIADDPADAGLLNLLGEIFLATGRVDQATPLFRQAIRMQPGEPNPHRNLASALLREGRAGAAVAALERVRLLRPGDPQLPLLIAAALRCAGRPEEALASLADEDSVPGFYHRGLALKSLGRPEEALAAFEAALALAPEDFTVRAARDSLALGGGGDPAGRRIGLLFTAPAHHARLRPVFDELAGRVPVLLTGDGDELAEFSPRAVAACQPLPDWLRHRLGGAAIHVLPPEEGKPGRTVALLMER
jgi:glycosyltransferase involved in cell wall biosynthesis/Flp pilus assembly protein TadD